MMQGDFGDEEIAPATKGIGFDGDIPAALFACWC